MFRNFKVRKSCCFCFPYNETDVNSIKWLQPTRDEARSSDRVNPTDPGYVYIMIMEDCEGYSAPPFAKIGWTHNYTARRQTLNIGNPHQLTVARYWWVSNMIRAEGAAKAKLNRKQLRLNCDGGSEWYRVEDDLDDIDDFAKIVRRAIKDYVDEESEETSEEESEQEAAQQPEEESEEESEQQPGEESEEEWEEEWGDRGLAVSSINRAPNQAAAKMATNYGHNNAKWRQDLKGNMLHVKYNCK